MKWQSMNRSWLSAAASGTFSGSLQKVLQMGVLQGSFYHRQSFRWMVAPPNRVANMWATYCAGVVFILSVIGFPRVPKLCPLSKPKLKRALGLRSRHGQWDISLKSIISWTSHSPNLNSMRFLMWIFLNDIVLSGKPATAKLKLPKDNRRPSCRSLRSSGSSPV